MGTLSVEGINRDYRERIGKLADALNDLARAVGYLAQHCECENDTVAQVKTIIVDVRTEIAEATSEL
jgi:hypothetical protein